MGRRYLLVAILVVNVNHPPSLCVVTGVPNATHTVSRVGGNVVVVAAVVAGSAMPGPRVLPPRLVPWLVPRLILLAALPTLLQASSISKGE